MAKEFRIGQGFDVHRFRRGRKFILAGVEIPSDRGLLGHSDADAVLHALINAILGALGEGDIGTHFPDSRSTLQRYCQRQTFNRVLRIMRRKRLSSSTLM